MREQQKPSSQDEHHEGVVERGDQVMGFSHEKTTHHFRLYADGGAIEVEAKDAQDTSSRDQIRSHLGPKLRYNAFLTRASNNPRV